MSYCEVCSKNMLTKSYKRHLTSKAHKKFLDKRMDDLEAELIRLGHFKWALPTLEGSTPDVPVI